MGLNMTGSSDDEVVLPFIELSNREIRLDGVMRVPDGSLWKYLLQGIPLQKLCGTGPEFDEFNIRLVTPIVNNPPSQISLGDWQMPPEYLAIDLAEYVCNKFTEKLPSLGYDKFQVADATERIYQELNQIAISGMSDLFKCIIFIVDTFKANAQLWGVGRGSSCASYVLFIIGLHMIDCIKWDIDMAEFFHD